MIYPVTRPCSTAYPNFFSFLKIVSLLFLWNLFHALPLLTFWLTYLRHSDLHKKNSDETSNIKRFIVFIGKHLTPSTLLIWHLLIWIQPLRKSPATKLASYTIFIIAIIGLFLNILITSQPSTINGFLVMFACTAPYHNYFVDDNKTQFIIRW